MKSEPRSIPILVLTTRQVAVSDLGQKAVVLLGHEKAGRIMRLVRQ